MAHTIRSKSNRDTYRWFLTPSATSLLQHGYLRSPCRAVASVLLTVKPTSGRYFGAEQRPRAPSAAQIPRQPYSFTTEPSTAPRARGRCCQRGYSQHRFQHTSHSRAGRSFPASLTNFPVSRRGGRKKKKANKKNQNQNKTKKTNNPKRSRSSVSHSVNSSAPALPLSPARQPARARFP